MAKVQIKSEKLTPFGGIFMVMEQFDSMLSSVIDSTLGQRCSSIIGYRYSEIVRSLMSVYFCGGSCVEDVTSHLMRHLSNHPTLRTCSSDTILRAIRELTQDNISYTSDQGKTYDFNTADKLNTLLVNALISTGELNEAEAYDVDFDHQFLETEKYDAKPTYKKFLGYRPGVYVIGDNIAYIENSDGNTNVRFHQADTHKRFFSLLESKDIHVNRFRADCGSCSEDIVSEVEKHCTHFYIRANRCGSLYNDIFALRGWKTEEINGIQFELNSILVEKWEGKCHRLVIQRQRRTNGDLDLWEGEYTYRCILTNDYKSSARDIVEFYNLRGGKERIFDDMNNGFGWNRLPKSFMAENTAFLLLTALIHNFYETIMSRLDAKAFGLRKTSRIKAFVFRFVSVPAKWIMTARQCVLNIYTENRAYARPFKTEFG
ncbi:MAG: IS1380 family transposase [Bacteroidaceae bacterium]|nr:IS1380 family transposase [Bacteroidaceae bacterium]